MSSSADTARRLPRVLRDPGAAELRGPEGLAVSSAAALAALTGTDDGPSLADQLAVERAEGRAEGYAEGYAAALANAESARARAVELAAQRLEAAAAEAATSRATVVAEVAAEAIELTYALARTIIGDEAVAASLPIRSAVARALQLVPEGEDLVVRIPPACQLTPADLAGLCDTARISVRVDDEVEPGGCIVEAGACRIDTQISTALARVRKVLAELRPVSEPDAAEGDGA